MPEAAATVVAPGDLEAVNTSPTSRASFVATGSLTAGRYGLFRYDMLPESSGARTHIHTTFSESFYVLSGVVSLYDGNRWVRGDAGFFLYVPERSVHGFKNDTDAPASILVLFAPAPPRERFFREIAEVSASGRTLSEEEWRDLYRRHDQYMVPERSELSARPRP
jgi:quercetin dioxygenase-like cupin family protein